MKKDDTGYFEESPTFWRTRTINVAKINGNHFLHCSCGFFARKGLTCCHIYCLNNRELPAKDSSLKHLKSRAVLYGYCAKHTRLCNEHHSINQESNGPLTDFPIQLNKEYEVKPER